MVRVARFAVATRRVLACAALGLAAQGKPEGCSSMNPEACVSDDWDYPLPWTENELKRWQKAFW